MTAKPPVFPPTGVYEHYKSAPKARRYYQLLGFARHTETEQLLAIYIPLYVTRQHPGVRLQARPLDMFVENVVVRGETRPRFKYIGQELN